MQIQLDSHWKPLTKQTTVLVTVDAKRIQLWAQNDDSYTFFRFLLEQFYRALSMDL